MFKKALLILFVLSSFVYSQDMDALQSQTDEAASKLKIHDVMGAEMIIQSVLGQDSTFAPAQYLYSELELTRGNLNESRLRLRKAIGFKPDDENYRTRFEDLQTLVNQMKDARREMESGALDASINIYKDIVNKFPEMSEAYYMSGIISMRQGNYKYSAENFKKAQVLAPDVKKYADATFALIGNYFKEGMDAYKFRDYATAEEKFRICVDIDPTFVNAYLQLGVIKKRSGDLDGAITCLEKGVEAAPEDTKALYNLGLFYQKASRLNEAKVKFSKVIELNPNYYKAYNGLANIYMANKEYKKAEENYKKAVKLDDNYAAAWDGYGALLLEMKKYKAAKNALEKATKLKPRNYRGFYRLSEVNNHLENYSEAIEAAHTATKLNKKFAPAFIELGFAYAGMNKTTEAINAFNRARSNPSWRKYATHQVELLREGKPVER